MPVPQRKREKKMGCDVGQPLIIIGTARTKRPSHVGCSGNAQPSLGKWGK